MQSTSECDSARALAVRLIAGTMLALWLAAGFTFGVQAATLDSGPRVALVIGNAGYRTMPLSNPLNDALSLIHI